MDILLLMCIGMAAGRFAVPASFRRPNELLQTACTYLLIFSMGISISGNPMVIGSIGELGWQSLLFCLLPTAGSIALVYPVSERVMGERGDRGGCDGDKGKEPAKSGGGPMRRVLLFAREEPMAIGALVALLLGISLGFVAARSPFAWFMDVAGDVILSFLMFLVGISVGMHRGLVSSVREHHIKTLVIPAGIVVGSLAGGVIAALFTELGVREGCAIASGFGWYSLAGVTVEGLAGARLGTIAFLSSLMRELISFFSIPIHARRLNAYACIAAAAATSEDTTLPMMIRYTDERSVVYSLVNGIICSALVPILVTLFLG